MKRQIVTDANVRNGEPHFAGTNITVAELKAFYWQRGNNAIDVFNRFPEIGEYELTSAITFSDPRNAPETWVAENEGPPKRLFWLYREPTIDPPQTGWRLVIEEVDANGAPQPLSDTWEPTIVEILRYPAGYASGDLHWRRQDDGSPTDVSLLND